MLPTQIWAEPLTRSDKELKFKSLVQIVGSYSVSSTPTLETDVGTLNLQRRLKRENRVAQAHDNFATLGGKTL